MPRPLKILLVDGSPLMFRAFTGPLKGFTNGAGERTGLRFGFLRACNSYAKRTKADKVIVVWDAHGPHAIEQPGAAVRPQALERGYKGNRDHSRPEAAAIWAGHGDLKAALQLTRWAQAWQDGYEADDVIGTLARTFSEQGHETVIASPDRDLWQLISPAKRITCWQPGKKSAGPGEVIGPREVVAEFGVPPTHLLFWRAVEGDASDGLKGIGASSATKAEVKQWLKSIPGAPATVAEYEGYAENLTPGTRVEVFGRHRDDLLSNFDLMELKPSASVKMIRGEADPNALGALFARLEFRSLMKSIPELTGRNPVEDL